MSTSAILGEMQDYLLAHPGGARSLSPLAYADTGIYELEIERIFLRSWICVGREAALASPGDYLCLTLAGESVIVVRGGDGALRAMSNVCRHRLFPIVPEGSGNLRRFTCGYHRWVYALDGRLAGAPHMEATPAFDRAACVLPRFKVESWLGFVFVNLDADAGPLAPGLAGVEAALSNHDITSAVAVAGYRRTWNGNWKLALENASESYHHMGLHARSVEPNMPAAGTHVVEITDHWVEHRTPLRPEIVETYLRFGDFPCRMTEPDRAEMKVFTIFPCLVLLTVGDLIQTLNFLPIAPDRVDVHVTSLVPAAALAMQADPEAFKEAMRQGQNAVNAEDERATALVQANVASRFAARGWLSEKEAPLLAFHAFLARRLLADAAPPPT